MSENENNIEFPVEYTRRKLNALYREIPLKDTTSRLLRKYFCAMANLYGVIRLGKAYEIISELSPSLVTKEEFLAFAEIARHEDEFYYILGREELFNDVRKGSPLDREIIYIDLLDDEMKSYIETINRQEGKPYYIPTKKELLCYVDDYYVEKTPQAAALKACLMKCFRIDAEEAEELLGNISIEARRTGNCFQNVFDMFEMCGYEFRNDKDAEKFIGLYQDFHNTSRKQTNRGYTPTELNEMCPPEERMPKSLSFGPNIKKSIASGDMNADELRKAIMAMDFPNEELRRSILNEIDKANKNQPVRSEKIGRNEPCPCGSGKKYKNCCGR